MNITDVNNLDRGFSAGCRSRSIGWLRGGEVDRIISNRGVIAKTKYCGAEKGCGVGWNIHVAKVVGQDWSLASNRTIAYIVIIDLYRGSADIHSSGQETTNTGQNADFSDDIHKIVVTKMCESLQNHQQSLYNAYTVSIDHYENYCDQHLPHTQHR